MLTIAMICPFLNYLLVAGLIGSIVSDCPNNWIDCGNGQCVASMWACDNDNDCGNMKDEENCDEDFHLKCLTNQFKCDDHCIPEVWLCDGQHDCLDETDERNCGNRCKGLPCSEITNIANGRQCYCKDGYQLHQDNESCIDVNECAEEGFCSHQCINIPGGYICICEEGYELVNRSCIAAGPEPLLLFSTFEEIRGVHLRSDRHFLIRKTVHKSVAVDVDPLESKVYWAEISKKSSIYSTNIDGTGFDMVLGNGLLTPEGIAIDYRARNLYVTDSGLKQVLACKTDGTMCHVLHGTSLEKPQAIAVDPPEGFMYWSDWGDNMAGIYRSGMDGSQIIHMVSKAVHWAKDIAIDHTTDRLYWTDARLQTIEFISLDGVMRKIIIRDQVYHPYSLAVFEDSLYWTDWYKFSLNTCNKFTGHKMATVTMENGKNIVGVHVYHPVLLRLSHNPCRFTTCSHMCLTAPFGRYRCVCPPGFILSGDRETCKMDSEFPALFVYDDSKIFHVRPEAVGSSIVTVLPIGHLTSIHKVIHDRKTNSLFVSHSSPPAIYAVNMTSWMIRELVNDHLGIPEDLAFDWMSDNLYWVDSAKGTVEIIDINTSLKYIIVGNLTKPTAISIDPPRGLMFVSVSGETPLVIMYDMDGKNPRVLNRVSGVPMSLAILPSTSRLFWVDRRAESISSLNYLEPSSQPVLHVSKFRDVTSVAVSERFLYWTSMKNPQIHMVKMNTTHIHLLSLQHSNSDFSSKKITYSSIPLSAKYSPVVPPCSLKNGGCSYLCVSSPEGRSCLCSPGMTLSKDNVTCEAGECTSGEYRCTRSRKCISKAFVCDGVKDCEDGSDEICSEPRTRCPGNDFQCRNGRCIFNAWKCDRRDDCGDNSDEENCPPATSCANDQFSCADGHCISLLWRCDGESDCDDHSDEKMCHMTVCDESHIRCDHGQCIPKSWVCDGADDCLDGMDERNCSKGKHCGIKEFPCSDGKCIDKSLECNGRKDCEDGSDESNCFKNNAACKHGTYQCQDGLCIDIHEVCDGYKDCSKGEDETNCTERNCTMDEFLCTFSKRCISRRWLCDNHDDCGDAADENITNCISRKLHRIPLKIEQIEECKDFLCSSGECLPWSKVCDFQTDCADLSDESSLCTKVCARNGGCSQKCIKTPYKPKCSCFNGFSLMSDGKTCEDVNECHIYGSCSHFCNNTKGGFKCSCAQGYFLEHDRRRCKVIGGSATLVYLLLDEIRGIDMNTHTPKVHLGTKNSLLRGIDYNAFDGVFYCSDRFQKTINSYTVDSNREDKLINCEKSPSYVRWDWITKIIYYVEDDGTIKACSKDGKHCASLLKSVALYLNGFDISPTYGFMFWCVGIRRRKWSSGIIERAEMDGSNRITIISENIYNPLSLTVDFIPKLVYWFDSKYNILECADFHGQSRKQILISHAYSPLTFTIFEDYLFFADYNTDSLIRCNKFTGVSCVQFLKGNGRYVEALMAVHVAQQPESINRCSSNECAQLCLSTHSSYVCRCSDGFTLRGNKCDIVMTMSSTARPKLSCPHSYCLQGARCVVVGGKFICQCPAAYAGDKCEIQLRAIPGGPYIYFWSMVIFMIACLIAASIFCIQGCKEIRLRNKIITRMSELRNEMPEIAKYY